MHWAKAAALYFALVFGAGFVLGPIRILLLVPRIGVRAAELLEIPLMLVVTLLAARWLVLCFGGRSVRRASLRVGFLALCLLVAAEIGLGSLRGSTVSDYITARDPVSGTVYFAALALFAFMPTLVVRGIERRPATPGLIDEFLPRGDVEENHEIVIAAPADLVFDVAENFDLPILGVLRSVHCPDSEVRQSRDSPRSRTPGTIESM